jgi:hypothetical protein
MAKLPRAIGAGFANSARHAENKATVRQRAICSQIWVTTGPKQLAESLNFRKPPPSRYAEDRTKLIVYRSALIDHYVLLPLTSRLQPLA